MRGWYVFWCFTTRLSAKPLSQSVGGFNVTCIFNWRGCSHLDSGQGLRRTALGKRVPLPETNSSPLKIDGWNTTFLLGFGPFSGALAVSFRESTLVEKKGQLPPKVTGFMGGPSFSNTFFLVPLKRLHLRMQWWCETRLHFLLSLSELVINSN